MPDVAAVCPIRAVIRDDDLTRPRLTVLFRLLLALPHLVWLAVWSPFATLAGWAIWLLTVLMGRPPAPLHRFLGSYVRYATHVFAYLLLAGRRFPGFLGRPGYEIDIEIAPPARQGRLPAFFRLLLALPVTLFALSVGAGIYVYPFLLIPATYPIALGAPLYTGLLGWFAALALGRMPRGLRDLSVYGLGYTAQVAGYALLLTDRFPDTRPGLVEPALSLPEHPVRLDFTDDLRRSRLTVFFRLLLALPHIVWYYAWSVLAVVAWPVALLVALVRGTLPRWLHRFLTAYVRYSTHLTAFMTLVGGPFPGFVGAEGSYPVDLEIDPPAPQRRLTILFRLLLAVPAFVVVRILWLVLSFGAVLAWFSCLARGRMPRGLCELGAAIIRYSGQTLAYAYFVTGRYPYASPALEPPSERHDGPTSGVAV